MASGNTSIPIASAADGAGKEFFSGSEEKTRKQKRGQAALESMEGREGMEGLAVKWTSGDEATQ